MSRLDFAPKIDEIKITDIKRGLGIFAPKSDKVVSFSALKAALKKAGYALASAEITLAGTLIKDQQGWWVESETSKQRFAVEGDNAAQLLSGLEPGARIEMTGDWQTVQSGPVAREVIRPRAASRVEQAKPAIERSNEDVIDSSVGAIQVSIGGTTNQPDLFFAPIRTTSPGLTVYKGGAFTPRYSYTRQHLGNLEVDRHSMRLGISYTPTPTLQLEAEVPYQSTSFDDGARSGSGSGFGNLTLWGKYRFYRTLEMWGDKQAALRFGLELPTGKKSAPSENKLDAPEFVRQQLSAINGGFAFHLDAAYSQARRRFIYGANVEGTLRTERDGFRTGHELRVNTDFEYVLLPFKYKEPGRELFAILETTYMYRSRGRVFGAEVAGSSGSEFYLAPGFQFTATARLVVEASYQFPVVHNTGPQLLRTDRNFLVGIRYLY